MTDLPFIDFLEWDSGFFQIKVGKICIEHEISSEWINDIFNMARQEKYKLLYIFAPFSEGSIKKIENVNLTLVDQKVLFCKQIKLRNEVDDISQYIFEYKDNSISSELLDLTFESGRFSRFRIDKNFSNDIFFKLYSEWIRRSVDREIADKVLVYKKKSECDGMLTYKIDNKNATIGLIAVNPFVQGQNIGSKLIHFMEHEIRRDNIKKIDVATQLQNTAACSFYRKNQFNIKQITNIYHMWL